MAHKLENVSSVNDTFFAKRLVQNIPRVIELDIYTAFYFWEKRYTSTNQRQMKMWNGRWSHLI